MKTYTPFLLSFGIQFGPATNFVVWNRDTIHQYVSNRRKHNVNPFPNDKFYTLPNSMCLQTTISNLTKMVKKFYKWVENTVGKGEIARYEQFLLFPHVFKSLVQQTCKKPGLVWERVKRRNYW